MTAKPVTAAPAYRSVDQLTGKIADLERRHAEDVQLCAAANSAARTAQRRLVDAEREIAALKAERSELYRLVDSLRTDNTTLVAEKHELRTLLSRARAERDTAKAMESRRGW